MKRWATVGLWGFMWLVAFACTVALSLGRPVNRKDEAWMLWVLHRVAGGDALYRSVYNVTTPLAAWIGAAVVWLTAPELQVLRALVAAVLAAQVVLAASIARRAGLRWPGVVVLATALVALGSPIVVFTSLYTACAVLGALAALRAILWWFDRTDAGASATVPLVATGAAAAFAFWCKPNIGALALAAAIATVLVTHRSQWRRTGRELVPMLLAFGALSAAVSTVLLVTRAWSDFVDQVVLSKRQYVDVGFSYATAIERRIAAFDPSGAPDLRSIVWLLVLVTPVLVVAVLAWSCWCSRGRSDPRLAAFVAFGSVGLLGVYPRPGVEHIGGTLPLTLTAAACAVVVTPSTSTNTHVVLRRVALVATSVVVALGTLIVTGATVDAYTAPDMVVDAPHFAGLPLPREVAERAARLRDGLRERTDGVVFIAREDAGFMYLQTKTRNPLAYDIAERSDFGRAGQRGVIERIRRGEAEWICLYPLRSKQGKDPLVPHHLERWVRANTDFAVHLPGCDLYRATTSRGPGSTTVVVRPRTSP